MSEFVIKGGNSLYGGVKVSPAKNSVLTLMCASILLGDEVLIKDAPNIGDVNVMAEIINAIGGKAERKAEGLYINTKNVCETVVPKDKSSMIRASFFLCGALVSRFKSATLYKPGGCKIGERNVDIHLEGLKKLGVQITDYGDRYYFECKKLCGAKIKLRYPSVGATENLITAAVSACGVTIVENAAKEPEVKDLCDFLNLCGAKIKGGGSSKIYIQGVQKLNGKICYKPIPDRVETATFLLAGYLLGGKFEISSIKTENIYFLMKKIRNITCNKRGFCANIYREKIYIQSDGNPEGLGSLVTAPYPMFATDMHPLCSAVGAAASGVTEITENVFESRFSYLDGLKLFGADYVKHKQTVTFFGRDLHSADVTAPDLRGGACYVLAALKAQGVSTVKSAETVMRGYDGLDKKLATLGANIKLTDGKDL